MEFREYNCPYCKGILQVPTDRDRIKCMYCGKDIAVIFDRESAAVNSPKEGDESRAELKIKSNARALEDNLDLLINSRDIYYDNFNKKHYDNAFREFNEKFMPFIEALDSLVLYSKSGVEGAGDILKSFPERFAKRAFELSMTSDKKKDREFSNERFNIYMVSYVLPSIYEKGGERMEDLLEDICDAWRDTFPIGNIRPAYYDEISKGFKNGIFGLFRGKF